MQSSRENLVSWHCHVSCMKHKLVYCSFLESASNAVSVGINKNEINTEYQKKILLYMNNFAKHE